MSATVIRVAGESDAEAISRIHTRAREVAYADLVSPKMLAAMQAGVTPQKWAERMRNSTEGGRMLVAEEGGRIVGFIFVVPGEYGEPGVGDVDALHVDPEHQGAGIGTQLLRAGLEFLAGQGFSKYVLWVLDGNERAMRFYRKHGWQHDGQRVDDGGVDFLRFVHEQRHEQK
ncbi:MAG TPA: GNAT family N-acetyltransferase [Candidatus Limnocylindrales bacterium]